MTPFSTISPLVPTWIDPSDTNVSMVVTELGTPAA